MPRGQAAAAARIVTTMAVTVALLSKLGYQVVAATGKAVEADYLVPLGTARVIDRDELARPAKPLKKKRWRQWWTRRAAIPLRMPARRRYYSGAVAACGSASGFDFAATVMFF